MKRWTPLHLAAALGKADMCEALIKNKSPVRPQTDRAGELPSDLARANGHIRLAEMLESWTEDPAQSSSFDWLHGMMGRTEAIDALSNAENKSAFLIRNSNNPRHTQLTFTLDLKFPIKDKATKETKNNYEHYVIYRRGMYYHLDNGPLMLSLEHLVDYYML